MVRLELEKHTQWRGSILTLKSPQMIVVSRYQILLEEELSPEQWIKFSNISKNARTLIQPSWFEHRIFRYTTKLLVIYLSPKRTVFRFDKTRKKEFLLRTYLNGQFALPTKSSHFFKKDRLCVKQQLLR